MYAPRAFQWYKERHKPLSFDFSNCFLKFWESTKTPSPKVGVVSGVWVFTPSHSLKLSNTPGSMWCDSRAYSCLDPRASSCLNSRTSSCFNSWTSSWPATLQPLCLGREPKARVATTIFALKIWWFLHFVFLLPCLHFLVFYYKLQLT
jgi:hypothetical protein